MPLARLILVAVLVIAGTLHFAVPAAYLGIMPPGLPAPRALVYLSGALEIAGGVGLLMPATRAAAGWGVILLLLAVWPANFQMLWNARAAGAPAWQEALLWLRIPLQLALVWWVWRAAGLRGATKHHDVPGRPPAPGKG